MNKKHDNVLLRIMAIILEFLLYNIVYIILYSSALLIFINDCMFGIVVYFIASHITLVIVSINMVVATRNKPKPVKKITVLQLFYKSVLTIVAIIILMLKAHWYLATITIVIAVLSAKFYWKHTTVDRKRYVYEQKDKDLKMVV